MKHILFILDTFYPEYASTGQLMTELCQYLQNEFKITIIVGIPKYGVEFKEKYVGSTFYKEQFENISIIRVNTPKVDKNSKISRIKFIFTYFVNAFRASIKVKKPDIVYVISQPPILGGLLGCMVKCLKRSKLVYNIQDFNPEQAEAIGYTKSKLITSFARHVDNHTINHCDRVIVVGRDMEERLYIRNKKMIKHQEKVFLINNWIDELKVRPILQGEVNPYLEKYNTSNKFTVMYSGNIGLFYDLENIIMVLEKFKTNSNIRFLFVGDGAYREKLYQYSIQNKMDNVEFYPYVPKEDVALSLSIADVHLVTNQLGIKGVSVPSKIYGVLGVGKPVLGIIEEGSEASIIIQESDCGKVIRPHNYEGIYEAIEWFYNHQDEAKKMGEKGRQYLMTHLGMEKSLSKYKQILTKL